MKILKGYFKMAFYVNKLLGWVCASILSIMTILIFWQVIARFLTGSSLSFSEELARFLMIWLVMVGSAYALRNGEMISVDAIYDLLSEKIGSILKAITHLISIIFYIILLKYGYIMAQNMSSQIAPGTGISMDLPMLSFVFGGFFLIFNAFTMILKLVSGTGVEK